MKRMTTVAVIATLLLAATTMSPRAATITVTNTNDSGPGSLRQALANANNGDRINFSVTGAIALTSGGLPQLMGTRRYLFSESFLREL
jgi:hypothetical protein